MRFAYLHGSDPGDYRQQVLDAVRRGEVQVLIGTRILDEGIDLPNVRFLILAGGGKAGHVVIQKVGRGMRAAEGKDRLTVFDFMDEGRYLGVHSIARRKTYLGQQVYTLVESTLEDLLPKEAEA